ncbi:NAD-dependent epimerase/dehydratase family protein [Pseudomonas agarici]|uniref:NAD-dependent epimerase/dehydratase family protein n=1 Tax=Pseudomonas agarici TaxID=46677 RepID=UPI0002DDA6DC|nr:NAD(P)-dependent oxidoreductase [Pseudomonas agarici]NWB92050.1 NAD(P)-dependent oxidoreductase [Pseudomonas agarici]NWC09492.1 NAD(P)-dependent oxidoreductase [Pseudomonas agarici]SEL68859.1 Nucleoside-diphosphate-sugar epimerase [Pseudomonas agarici]
MNPLRVLLTGACGRIGKTFFLAAQHRYDFVLADRHQPDFAIGAHRFVRLDLDHKDEVNALVDGIDVVVHLAGIPYPDSSFEELLPNNITATTYLLEAAARAKCRRVVFASSAQTIEGYAQDRQVTSGMPVMPANLYGVSKCYGEALCAFYAARRGLSTIALRIGAFEFPDSQDLHHVDLNTWLSPRDAVQLLQRAIEVEDVQHLVAHGISNNRFKRLDLSETIRVLGYQPLDDSFQTFNIPVPVQALHR